MKEILKKNGILIAAHVLLVIVAIFAFVLVQAAQQAKEQIEDQLKAANEKIAAITKELGDAKTETQYATKELAEASSKTKQNNDNLAAFAKQAAACEKVKKQLKVDNT
jgi:hypothetical protein